MEEFKIKLGFELDSSSLNSIKKQLNSEIVTQKVKLDLSSASSEIASFKNKFKSTDKVKINVDKKDIEDSKIAYKQLLDIQKQISSSKIKVASLDVNKNKNEISLLNNSIKALTKDYESLNKTFGNKLSITQLGSIQKVVESTNDKIQQINAKSADTQDRNIQRLDNSKRVLSAQLEAFIQTNNLAAESRIKVADLKNELQSCDSVRFQGIKSEFQELKTLADSTSNTAVGFKDILKNTFSQVTSYLGAYASLSTVIGKGKEMYQNVLSVDTSLTDLNRVTDLSVSQQRELYDSLVVSAKNYGSTLTDIIDSTFTWAKLGIDPELSARLSEITTMYQHVGDIDTATAVENLVTSYKGFEDQLLESHDGDMAASIEYIADMFNLVADRYAVSAEGLGNALTRSASSLKLAGNDIQQTMGMSTGITEITQDAEKAGTALKVLSMRLRGATLADFEAIGEDADGLIESTSLLQDKIKQLTGVDIMIDDSTFKSTYQIMQEISGVFDDLSDINRASLIEIIAGKNRGSDITALISNWEQVEKATETAYNAHGSAAAEHDIFLNSLQGKLNSLEASWQSFSNTMINSDFVGGLFDGALALLNTTDGLIKNFGTINTLVVGVSAYLSVFKNTGFFSILNSDADKFSEKMGLMGKTFSELFAAKKEDGFKGFFTALKSPISKSDIDAIHQYNDLLGKGVSMGDAFNLTLTNTSKATQEAAINAKGAAVSQDALNTATKASTVSMIGAKAAAMAFNMVLSFGLSFAIQAVVSGLDMLINAQAKAAEKAKETADKSRQEAEAHSNEVKQLGELISKYEELASKDNIDFSTRSEIRDIQSEIVGLVGNQADRLDLVNGKLGNQLTILKEIETIKAKEALEKNTVAYYDSLREAKSFINSKAGDIKRNAIEIGEPTDELKQILENNKIPYHESWGKLYTENETAVVRNSIASIYAEHDRLTVLKDVMSSDKSTEDYSKVIKDLAEVNEQITNIEDSAYKVIDSIIASDSELSNFVANSSSDIEKYKSILIDAFSKNSEIQNMFENGSINKDDLNLFADSNIFDVFGNSNFYDEWYNQYVENIDIGFKKIKDNFKSKMDLKEFASPFKNENLKLINEFNDYIDSLSDEDKEIAYKISLNVDTSDFSQNDWMTEIESAKNGTSSIFEEKKLSFADIMSNSSDDGLPKLASSYMESIDKLTEAKRAFKKGKLDTKDFFELTKLFPQLSGRANDLDVAINELMGSLQTDIVSQLRSQLDKLDTEEARQQLLALIEIFEQYGNVSFSIDISAETEGMQDFFNAVKESVSSTGLSGDSIKALQARYRDLENYDPSALFEKTYNGIHLNTKALRELESAYEKQQKGKIKSQLQDLVNEYNSLTDKINTCSNSAKQADLYKQRSNIENQIQDVSMLASQYEGLTSAFYKWEQAQSIGEEGDMYDNLAGSLENIKDLYDKGLIGTNKFRTAVQLMSSSDLSSASTDELIAAYEYGYPLMKKYFTDSSDGCINFLEDVQGLNAEWAHMNENGEWNIDFGYGTDQEIADALGINVETVQSILRKMSDYDFNINLDSVFTSLGFIEDKAEVANSKLKEIGKTDITFNFDSKSIEDLESQIDDASALLYQFRNEDGTVNLDLEGAEEAAYILTSLIFQKQSLDKSVILSVDTSDATTDIGNVILKLQEFKGSYNQLELETALGLNTTEAQGKCDGLLTEIQSMNPEILATLGIDLSTIETLNTSISAIDAEVLITAGLDTSKVEEYQAAEHEADGKVIWSNDDSKITSWINEIRSASGVVNWTNNDLNVKTQFSATGYVNWVNPTNSSTSVPTKTARVNGTAHHKGTAFSQGDWGTKDSGEALGGELGTELVVFTMPPYIAIYM